MRKSNQIDLEDSHPRANNVHALSVEAARIILRFSFLRRRNVAFTCHLRLLPEENLISSTIPFLVIYHIC